MQNLSLNQSQQMRQEQTLAAAQIQSLDILIAPVMELQAKINAELETNPLLEQNDFEDDNSDSLHEDEFLFAHDEETPKANELEKSIAESGKIEAEDLSDDSNPVNDFEMLAGEKVISRNNDFSYSVDEEKREHFFSSLIDYETIGDDLISQINFMDMGSHFSELCNAVIGSLDEKGFFKSSLADLAVIHGVSIEEMQRALCVVQSLEPPGIGARDVKESILLQLERKGLKNELYERLINSFFEDIALNHYTHIAKNLNITIDKLKEMIDEIKKLNPYPYSRLSNSDESIFIVPELRIEKKDDEYVAIFEKEYQPRLKISDSYLEMLYSDKCSPETKEYIKQKIQAANNIIRSIELRRETLQKIAAVIIDAQYEFLEEGEMFLKPLTMKQVADKIGVHETTVSRGVANKFVQTPQGLLPLKFFFSAGFQSADGEMISNKSVMEKIRNIIDREDKKSPYSDDEIARILNEEGIPVARRTVAKYREEIGYASSRQRREI